MKDRLRKLRRTLDMTQAEFAAKVGSTAGNWTNYETGRRNPSRSVINNICKTFSVNEDWLRTGAGSMFVQRTDSDEIAALVDQVMADRPESFRRRLVAALSRIDDAGWDALEAFALSILNGKATEDRAAPPDDIDIEREVEAYRAQLIAEKKAGEMSSASSDTAGA